MESQKCKKHFEFNSFNMLLHRLSYLISQFTGFLLEQLQFQRQRSLIHRCVSRVPHNNLDGALIGPTPANTSWQTPGSAVWVNIWFSLKDDHDCGQHRPDWHV